MFCSDCGKPAQGKFCSHCGFPLTATIVPADIVSAEIVPDWEHEIRYETILQYPGVRTTIERHAKLAPKRLSSEQFMTICEKLVPLPVPMSGIAPLAQHIATKLGLQTNKQRQRSVSAPAAHVLVRALCSLARNGQALRKVTQANDGCLLEAELPSDMFSVKGDLLVSVRKTGLLSEVSATAHIDGQMFDWGKSNRCLDQLFVDLGREAA